MKHVMNVEVIQLKTVKNVPKVTREMKRMNVLSMKMSLMSQKLLKDVQKTEVSLMKNHKHANAIRATTWYRKVVE